MRQQQVTTKTGVVVRSERRPTVDRAWVIVAEHEDSLVDLEVSEDQAVFDAMVKRYDGEQVGVFKCKGAARTIVVKDIDTAVKIFGGPSRKPFVPTYRK